jgi:hypothetical protein
MTESGYIHTIYLRRLPKGNASRNPSFQQEEERTGVPVLGFASDSSNGLANALGVTNRPRRYDLVADGEIGHRIDLRVACPRGITQPKQ